MKILISLSRLPGEVMHKDFSSRLGHRFKQRDELNKRDESERDEENDWWDSLTDEQQDKYLKDHPDSRHKHRNAKKVEASD